ncbi:AAA family ATPase [Parapedobacter deserti]|uniref:AAA family ATPase n=1 Tax=Parapedobacter deserti TaxID=1912957 RepID=A0ABV7JNA3_9SPHI
MRIAIIGAHRVGKTTLAEKLHECLTDYELKAEPYYALEGLGYGFSEKPNVDDFVEQLDYSIKQILTSGDNVIFDRCPIDILAYIQALDTIGNIESIYHKVQSIVTEIDLLVFVPIERPDLIPRHESDLLNLRYQVNEILNDCMGIFSIETIEVTGTLSNRCDQVLGKISHELSGNRPIG